MTAGVAGPAPAIGGGRGPECYGLGSIWLRTMPVNSR